MDVSGNGPLMVRIPAPDDEGVVMRSLMGREFFAREMVRAIDAPDADGSPISPVSAPAGAPNANVEPPSRFDTAPPAPVGQTEAPRSRDQGMQGYEVRSRKPRLPQKASKTRGSREIDSPPQPTPVGTEDGWFELPAGTRAAGVAPPVDELDGVNRTPSAPVG